MKKKVTKKPAVKVKDLKANKNPKGGGVNPIVISRDRALGNG